MENEQQVLEFWSTDKSFEKSLDPNNPEYIYYDGPPFATGKPHYGHVLASFIKDTIPRFKTQQGFYVKRRFGWDTHGLPIEYEIDKRLGIKSVQEVKNMGIDKYNAECRSIVLQYRNEWKSTIHRIGRWVDMDKDYKTMDTSFMEKVWKNFKQLYDNGFVYIGYKVMPYSPGCGTALSKNEAESDYRQVLDPSLIVKFKISNQDNTFLLAWTTTPWTLTTNLALCVSETITYSKVEKDESFYILASNKVFEYFQEPKVVDTFTGEKLVGLQYEFLWPTYQGHGIVVADNFVKTEKGTGIIHLSPTFGIEDNEICVKKGLISNDDLVDPLDEHGYFKSEPFRGLYFKEADVEIIKNLKVRGLCFSSKKEQHDYRFCWRSGTPLIFRPVQSVMLAVNKIRERLKELNQKVNWFPHHIKDGRFGKWLENTIDWCVSRTRFWGTPIPMWTNKDFSKVVVVESIEKLEELAGERVFDLHREHLDHLKINDLHRVDFVFDCWFESGLMPYCSDEQPLQTADFIAEGLDQTRGWFYSLLVLSTMLRNDISYKNVLVNGLVLADDGQKMSKQKKNYPDPNVILNKYGSDCLRLYLLESPVTLGENIKFEEKGLKNVAKRLSTLQNCLKFLKDSNYSFVITPITDPSFLDKWILNRLANFKQTFEQNMNNFQLAKAIQSFYEILDLLSHWYLKLSKGNTTFLPVFGYCLYNLSIISASIIPFLSEIIYSYFTSSSVHCHSSHLDLYQFLDDLDLSDFIKVVQHVREARKYPSKMPLYQLTVHMKPGPNYDQLLSLEKILKKELNVRNLIITPNFDKYVKVKYVPNKITIGKRFREYSKKLLKLELKPNTKYTIDDKDFILDNACFTKTLETSGTLVDSSMVEIDQTLDEEAIETFWKASLYRLLQDTRKQAKLKARDQVLYRYRFESDTLGEYLKKLVGVQENIEPTFSYRHKIHDYADKNTETFVTVDLEYV